MSSHYCLVTKSCLTLQPRVLGTPREMLRLGSDGDGNPT